MRTLISRLVPALSRPSPGFSATTAGVLLLMGLAMPVSAQNAADYRNEDDKRIKSAEVVGALGDAMFGEEVNFYTGSTSFRHVDLVVPGNNGLPMEVARSLEVVGNKFEPFGNSMGDWELELPYVGGLFLEAKGWVNSTTTPTLRCSSANASTPLEALKAAPPGHSGFSAFDYWNGYDLSVPGRGKQALMLRVPTSPAPPTTGGPYPWLTKDLWQVSCLSSITNGSGEGFLALAPDGTRYFFNSLVSRPYRHVQRKQPTGAPAGSPQYFVVIENRQDIRLYASRVEDRFGNAIDYHWTAGKLTSITASDGRSLSFTYATSPSSRVTSVTDGTRVISYGYDGVGSLNTVTYPDSSQWNLQLASIYPTHFEGGDGYGDNWDMNSPECGYKRVLANATATGLLTHPSGAQGSFTFQFKRHVRASVPDNTCPGLTHLPPPPGVANMTSYPADPEPWDWVSWTPRTFDALAITGKQVSGPGVTSSAWTYAYAGNGAVLPDDYGPQTRSVTVTEPDNRSRVFTFGNRYNINEGQLLALDTYSGTTLLLHKQSTYVGNAEVASHSFPDRIGYNPNGSVDTFATERLRPLRVEELLQDEVAFTRTVDAFDHLARPISVTAESSLSYANAPTRRTDVTTYEDNLSSWVLGQVKTVVNSDSGKTVVDNSYHPGTSLLLTSASFGVLQPTLAYNADGTVASVTDRRNNAIALSNWYRGVPRSIALPNATTESATVDAVGRVTSVTDVLGTATGYGYDAGGRLNLVNYTNSDSVLWNDTTRGFIKAASAAYGLPVGHWTQTTQTGNARTTTYYDSLWRPRLVLTEDTANAASKSFVAKRYDAAGRESFTSYPLGATEFTSVDDASLKGIRSFYDGLGRVIRIEQDAEAPLGVLVTTTEYLPGFQVRVTNPRGYQTVTRYQAFDAPGTDAPVSIIAAQGQPEQQTTLIQRDVFGKPLSVTRSGAGQ